MLILLTAAIFLSFDVTLACRRYVEAKENDRTVVLLGSKGTGKSSLGISLLGYDPVYPHPWGNGNGCFEASREKSSHSHTKHTCKIRGNIFYYDSHLPQITVVDTPGFEKDSTNHLRNLEKTANFLTKEVKEVTLFVVMLHSQSVVDEKVLPALKFYEMMYGREFWKHVIYVVNFLPTNFTNNVTFKQKIIDQIIANYPVPLRIDFINPLTEQKELKKASKGVLSELWNLNNLKLVDFHQILLSVSTLNQEIVELKKKLKSEESSNHALEKATQKFNTLKKETKKPLCRRGTFPVVIKGKTIYENDIVYTFTELCFAAGTGVGCGVVGCVVAVLCAGCISTVFCKKSSRKNKKTDEKSHYRKSKNADDLCTTQKVPEVIRSLIGEVKENDEDNNLAKFAVKKQDNIQTQEYEPCNIIKNDDQEKNALKKDQPMKNFSTLRMKFWGNNQKKSETLDTKEEIDSSSDYDWDRQIKEEDYC